MHSPDPRAAERWLEILPPVRDSATATRRLCSVQKSERRSAMLVALFSCCSKLDTCVLYSESRGPGHDEERVPWIRLSAQVRSGLLRAEVSPGEPGLRLRLSLVVRGGWIPHRVCAVGIAEQGLFGFADVSE